MSNIDNQRAFVSNALRTVLDSVIPAGTKCALLDFPDHSNVGDSAIWLGEIDYLKARKCQIKYICDYTSYDLAALRRAVGNGVVLIHGGGNLGDVWPTLQALRERVISDNSDRLVIQFSQSIHFERPDMLVRAQAVFNAHPNLTLLVRDEQSLAIARTYFTCRALLCPDMAFYMDPARLVARGERASRIVYLSRTDKEVGVAKSTSGAWADTEQVDWLKEKRPAASLLYRCTTSKKLRRWLYLPERLRQSLRLYAANAVAQERLERGLELLTRGDRVVTDRLHAHILSVLLGQPNFVLDNNYGKISSFINTWTQSVPGVHLCATESEAMESANRFNH